MSDQQLNFEKWTTLLEPKPSDVKKAPVMAADELPFEQKSEPVPSTPPIEKPVAEPTVLSVSDLNGMIKDQLENGFKSIWIQGEISNFKPHTSGHFYFSLKDDRSQISAVMFKGFNGRLKFKPDNGMEVIVRGRVTVYEPRGNYQIFCETMEPVGAGALQKAFEQLKAKLQAEGLFDTKKKKPLPSLPKHIGVVTSPTGAAIQDILNVLGRRYKGGQITVIPARVQGNGAAQEIVRGIELANAVGGFDVLIVGRGGGSVEDMWCFNEEIVARAIYASSIPIISAVGHEIDFTIADFVADYRAPTPSAAAEIVAKSATELSEKVTTTQKRLMQLIQLRLSDRLTKLSYLQSRLVDPQRRLQDLSIRCDEVLQRLQGAWQRLLTERSLRIKILSGKLKNPQTLIHLKRQNLTHQKMRLNKEMQLRLQRNKETLLANMSLLESLSPLKVVQRGYAIVFSGENVVRSASNVKQNETLSIQLAEGAIKVSVVGPEKDIVKK